MSSASAQTPVVIVVPHSNTDDYYTYEHRLRSELVSEGFQPVSVEIASEPNAAVLKQSATRLTSPAAISLSIHDQMISGMVWIQARAGGRDLLRAVPDYPVGPQAPSVFAVKAADVLHGGLLELGYIGTLPETTPPPSAPTAPPETPAGVQAKTEAQPKPAPSAPPADRPVTTPRRPTPTAAEASVRAKRQPEPRRDRWQFRAMFAAAQSFLHSPLASGPSITITRRLASNWRLGFAGTYLAPVRGDTAPYVGKASVTQAFAGPRLELFQSVTESFQAYEFVDLGIHALWVTGETNAPNLSHSTHSYTGYAQIGFGGALSLTHGLHLAGQAGLLLPFKPANVQVLRTTVVEAAGPAATISAGLELSL